MAQITRSDLMEFSKSSNSERHIYIKFLCVRVYVCANGKLRNLLIENGTKFVCLFSVHLCEMAFSSSKCYHHFQRVLNRSNESTKNVLANKSVGLTLKTTTTPTKKKKNNSYKCYAWHNKHVPCVVFIKFYFDPIIHRYLPMHGFHSMLMM